MTAEPRADAPRVAVLGLGNLGAAIALRLRDAGFAVVGHDVARAARERAGGLGLRVVPTGADAVEAAEVVCIVVSSAAQVGACLRLLDGSTAVPVVHATLAPADLTTFGPDLVDAPVSGGPDRAREGALAVMTGGPEALVARARPVLEALGRVLPTGGIGSAQVTKLIGQMVFMTTQGALLEGERLADAYGVGWDQVRASLAEGTADCWALRHWGFFDEVAADYARTGVSADSRPWAKDLATAVALAEDLGVELPLTDAAARLVPPAIDSHGDRR